MKTTFQSLIKTDVAWRALPMVFNWPGTALIWPLIGSLDFPLSIKPTMHYLSRAKLRKSLSILNQQKADLISRKLKHLRDSREDPRGRRGRLWGGGGKGSKN